MWNRQINKLKINIAYFVYLRMYNIEDEPFKKVDVHLSDANNKWNCMALTFNDISFPSDDLSFQKTELVSVSEKNNQWNKLATKTVFG
jgi:hypothetical protein